MIKRAIRYREVKKNTVKKLAFGRFYHPIWTMIASTTLVAASLTLMQEPLRIVAVALVVYGGGFGLGSIVRGTVPLRLFGLSDMPH